MAEHQLKRGIISVLQTPFCPAGAVDFDSFEQLVGDAIRTGVDGFLVPAVASEVEYLTAEEREEIVRRVAQWVDRRVPLVVGASSDEVGVCQSFARVAEDVDAEAYLVAVPAELYVDEEGLLAFFTKIASTNEVPLLIQDLQWNGPGLDLDTVARLKEALPTLIGLKIETVPAGPKYTAVRERFGEKFFIAGGWAVPQWIEALDRGIDAMIPESAMIGVYAGIYAHYQSGGREVAIDWFRRLLPILTYSNQEIGTSIAFFKRLLVRRGVIQHDTMRMPGFAWDEYNSRVAEELISLYLELENEITDNLS